MTLCLCFVLSGSAFAADSIKIIINKKINKIAFFKNGTLIKIFPVATGRRTAYTPEGTFKVVRKLVKPAYRKLRIPGGSPRNPLGARWLGLNARGTSGGTYGIHGTNNPKSIGTYASGGCIRMFNSDAIWLYDNTPLYTVVEIINRDWDLAPKPVKIIVNGNTVNSLTGKTYITKDRVMAPGREFAENLGCSVAWNRDKREAVFCKGATVIKAVIGSAILYVNGLPVQMDSAATIRNREIYLPVRVVAQSLGLAVSYDSRNHQVLIKKIETRSTDKGIP